MANVNDERETAEAFRREMAMEDAPEVKALIAHDSIATLLLAVLRELREIKAKLPNA